MEFKIHFSRRDGTEDSFIIEGETIEECSGIARNEISGRGLVWETAGVWYYELQ